MNIHLTHSLIELIYNLQRDKWTQQRKDANVLLALAFFNLQIYILGYILALAELQVRLLKLY